MGLVGQLFHVIAEFFRRGHVWIIVEAFTEAFAVGSFAFGFRISFWSSIGSIKEGKES